MSEYGIDRGCGECPYLRGGGQCADECTGYKHCPTLGKKWKRYRVVQPGARLIEMRRGETLGSAPAAVPSVSRMAPKGFSGFNPLG